MTTRRRPARKARGASARRPRAAGKLTPPRPEWLINHPWLREAGVLISSETASQVAAVYGCCRLIVDCLAPAPIDVVEVKANGTRESRFDDPIAYTLNWGAPIQQAPDAPPSQAIEEALLWSALLGDGNGYAEIQRDLAGRFFALWPIEPDRVTPRRDDSGFHYEVSQPWGGTARVEPINMFVLRGPSLKGWVGDSIVYRAAKAIGIAHAGQVFSAAYLANGTVISGLLTSDKVVTQPQADKAREEWVARHGGGPAKAHGISVLGQGLKYQPLNHNAQESQLVEGRRFQVQEIARFFGVPTTLLADNEAWTNLSELYRGFYTNALRPWAERFDAEATRKLFPQRQPWREVQHDLTHLTLGSFKDQVSALREAVNGGLWTRNEARKVWGKNTIGAAGDVLVVEGNVKSLEDVLDPPAPAPAAPPKMPGSPPRKDPEGPEVEPEGPEDARSAPVKTRPGLSAMYDGVPPDSPAPRISARDAVVAVFSDAFARHARRLANHRANHRGEIPEADQPGLAAKLTEDCAAGLALAKRGAGGDAGTVSLDSFAAALVAGEPPDKAAERFVSGIWRDAA